MEKLNLPKDNTHIFRMTDDTGIFQHAKYSVPDPTHGYTTDDNARALIMAALLYEIEEDPRYLDLAYRYLQFLLHAWDGDWFRNFMNYQRSFLEERGSDDCFGRSIWSLGIVSSAAHLPSGLRKTAVHLLEEALAKCRKLRYIRGKAYTLLGLCKWESPQAEKYIELLATPLAEALAKNARGGWFWFEDELTYCNAVLPLALLEAGCVLNNEDWLSAGKKSLDFLLKNTFRSGVFWPVGCKGWFKKGGVPARFDKQPVEACETLIACLQAYELTGNLSYRAAAEDCLAWYAGKNSAGISLIDPETGGCRDGITTDGLNENQGAESLISWHIARSTWEKAKSKLRKEAKKVSV